MITGATGGLGKAFCKALVLTDNLFLTGRSEEKLLALKEELLKIKPNAKIEVFSANLTSVEDRKNLFEFVDKNNIRFDGLINVAGVDTQKKFTDYTQEKIVFQVRVNVEATISITHEVLSRREEYIKILTVASMSGTVPMPYFAIYSATKDCLINFFYALRYEVEKAKITTLIPGGIPTREDIIKDIEIQGITGKLSSKSPEFVVKKGLLALDKNRAKVIPGFFNKTVYFIGKITPKRLQCKYVAKKWSKKTKDNF